MVLRSKKGGFDWTLGNSVTTLRNWYNAGYALFIHMRDSLASAGRAVAILAAAILRAGLQGGQQIGFASRVDIKTGEVSWFNLHRAGSADLRQEDSAQDAIKSLMKELQI